MPSDTAALRYEIRQRYRDISKHVIWPECGRSIEAASQLTANTDAAAMHNSISNQQFSTPPPPQSTAAHAELRQTKSHHGTTTVTGHLQPAQQQIPNYKNGAQLSPTVYEITQQPGPDVIITRL